jgi:hypothetical protein
MFDEGSESAGRNFVEVGIWHRREVRVRIKSRPEEDPWTARCNVGLGFQTFPLLVPSDTSRASPMSRF